jgi:aminoglycoside 3-N-acetyltransferase
VPSARRSTRSSRRPTVRWAVSRNASARGRVLLFGASLDRLTILHHAESLVDSPQKRMAHHESRPRGRRGRWRDVFDQDTSTALGAFPYELAAGDRDPFAVIGRLALDAGCGISGLAGNAVSHLFPPDRRCAWASNG